MLVVASLALVLVSSLLPLFGVCCYSRVAMVGSFFVFKIVLVARLALVVVAVWCWSLFTCLSRVVGCFSC